MPNFKLKSEQNINAANLLIAHEMFAASIHCSYYSAFQLSKYAISHFCHISYERQEKESKGGDSHFYVVDKIGNDLSKKNIFYMADYNKWYSKLKQLRKKSDYSIENITKKEAQKAYDTAKELNNLLINKYGII